MDINKKVKILQECDPQLAKKTDNIAKFLTLYAEGNMDKKEAWIAAGFSETTHKRSAQVLRENRKILNRIIGDEINSHSGMALKTIVELCGAKNEATRLKAAQDLMSRAGHDTAIKIESTVKNIDKMAVKEIDDEIKALLNNNNDDDSKSEELH